MAVPIGAVLAGTPRRLPHGEVVVRQGDLSGCLYFVMWGAVRLSSVTEAGREIVVAILGPGDVFGEAALLGLPSPVDARTIGDSETVAIPVPMLQDVLEHQSATATELLRIVAARLHRTSRALEEALAGDVTTRLSRRLRDLAEAHGVPSPEGVRIRVPITQEELARMVGSSRETVNRTLGHLIERGLIRTSGRTVVIPDPSALDTEGETLTQPGP